MPRIMWVHGPGGPTMDYALPKVAALADVHVVPLVPLPPSVRPERIVPGTTVADLAAAPPRGPAMVNYLVEEAKAHGVDGILTVTEFTLIAAAEAAERLGLPGPGPNVLRARDKLVMREVWAAAGVPVPGFRPVASAADLRAAWDGLGGPLLLKATCSAGSMGQVLLHRRADADEVWATAREAIARSFAAGKGELTFGVEGAGFLAETVIPSTTRSWYDVPGYGDYLSVEGLVVDGRYHPVCVTGRIPTIAPYTELSNQAPCVLPEPLQRQIEQTARDAVDALELGTCGTHTELKLLDDRGLCLLETSARLAGAMVVREVEVAYGVDLVTELTRALLGQPVDLSERMLVDGGGRRAAASIAMLATDSRGRPWSRLPEFRPERIDWSRLLSPGSNAEVVAAQSLPPGSPMPPYDAAAGFLNFAGLVFLDAPDPATLLADTYSVLDGLEEAMAG